MLPPYESLTTAKEAILTSLKARNVTQVNSDPVPEDPSDIELGIAVDKADPEKGWTRLDVDMGGSNKKSRGPVTLQAANLRNGQAIAFRFRKPQDRGEEKDDNLDFDMPPEDPGWDVVLPSLDDEDEEAA